MEEVRVDEPSAMVLENCLLGHILIGFRPTVLPKCLILTHKKEASSFEIHKHVLRYA